MRYIKKGSEPNSLIEYRKKPNAYFDGYTDKAAIREKLMEEQGRLCGYCMRRIKSVEDVKIEHIVPQSVLREDERQALDYRIMIGVCRGNERKGRKKSELTCDAHRGNDDLNITPFDKIAVDKICYTSEGYIDSDDENIKDSLQNTLNLNYDGPDAYLVQNRKAVIDECKKKLRDMQETGMWNRRNLERMLEYYQKPNEKGEYIPFSGVAIWYLNKRLKRIR